ncbi:MAG: (S)-ureidoglycine aminohydrolase [Oscillospiraceae bacterium]|jgi:(S)-ureidoglycine aminohydrolase|nr:(S)-ureidoglycine aminohydrolase [Oscillospiraceae bacterium]
MKMSYPSDLLSTRAVIKPGLFAVIPKEGLVNNVIPYIQKCKVSIVASPKMGANFVEYVVTAEPEGGTTSAFGKEEHTESFLYCISGTLDVKVGEQQATLTDGGYVYAPAGVGIHFENTGETAAKLLLYKQIYIPWEGVSPHICVGNTNDIPYRIYDEMSNVYIKDLLPTDIGFDMNMHILAFEPGGCHPFVETHVQEHGAYILSGEGMYLMDDTWMGIKKEDFMWFGPYVPQCAYGVGRELFAYIYSKDCNRDVTL